MKTFVRKNQCIEQFQKRAVLNVKLLAKVSSSRFKQKRLGHILSKMFGFTIV